MSPKKVLIAHQSTIPHYRVPFYEAVERLRPKWWEFFVVYDTGQARDNSFLAFDRKRINFQIVKNRTYAVKFGGKQVVFQTFALDGSKYDLFVVGSELKNVSYPISFMWRLVGKSVAYWGHGRDFSVEAPRGLKALAEGTKVWLTRRADGFFAYTNHVRDYMVSHGVDQAKIFVLQNTIDITSQRTLFDKLILKRDALKAQMGLAGKKVLLFVGRLTRQKRLDLLIAAFAFLRRVDDSFHLLIIGGGDESFLGDIKEHCGEQSVTYCPATNDISQACIVSDLYVLPGAIGLGPVHALCFDLTPVVIHSNTHKPEYEYLNSDNALILPEGSSPEQLGLAIEALLKDPVRWVRFRSRAWPSIKHLTIENMAINFIGGVNHILTQKGA
jgi:glycosyltransferase involved in cell wall biosynthesis